MTIRTILVPVDGSETAASTMTVALQFGRDIGAHVEVLLVRSDPKDTIPLIGEGMSVAMIEDMIQIAEKEGRERANRGRKVFDDQVKKLALAERGEPEGKGASAVWSEEIGRDDEITARRGRLADLLVVGRPTASTELSTTLTLNAALFDTGRPVLVVPPGGAKGFGKNVAISWNGSAESARAVGAAMPILARAERVTVLTAATYKTQSVRAQELATYLQWHGIKAATRTLDASGDNRQAVAVAMLAALTENDVDLLVMGAYTHSRMRQLILGGFTRHVLENATLPVFMSH